MTEPSSRAHRGLHPPQVTRSSAAFTASAAGRVARQRLAQPNGWWGMALFLCAEVALFGTMISSYFYLDFDAHRWPPAGIPDPSILWPSIGTAVLVAMSFPMWLAARSAIAGRRGRVLGLVSGAMIVQGCYLGLQIILLIQDLHKFKPQGSAYGSIYYTLLVAHHAHVLFGLLLDLTILVFVSFRGLTNYWLIGVRSLALYWHVVNVIAVFVLVVTLAPSL